MILHVSAVQDAIDRSFLEGRIRFEPVVDSTNRVAREMIAAGLREPFIVVTDFQEAGQGRRGRQWAVPAATSLLSTIAIPVDSPESVSDLIHVAALAVCDALASVDITGVLKWPNDVMLGGKKVSGILAEMVRENSASTVIVGVGINVNVDFSAYPDLEKTATSVSQSLGHAVSRETMLAAYVEGWDRWYTEWLRSPERVFSAWKGRLETLGQRVRVVEDAQPWEGYATGVRRDGALLVRGTDGTERAVYAADVSVRRA